MQLRRRVLVAMSGGVDSSVAAARLSETDEVVGVTLHLWDYPDDGALGNKSRCCAPEDQYDARRVADALGVPHFTFDRRDLFARTVVTPFVDAYLAGETPSPCTACNRGVKLAELFALADRLGASHVATGHYARIVRAADGTPHLATGADSSKDQSYFLFASPRAWLERLLFPLGESTKSEVRAEATARRLPGADKGESQELCFVGGKPHAHAAFVAERAADRVRPGLIVDAGGATLGAHDGVHRFTVGQRKGLGVAAGRPVFVTRIDAKSATVHVGDASALGSLGAELTDVTLAAGVSLPFRATVRVRYRHEGAAATVDAHEAGARVAFEHPVQAVTAGQMAVFYRDERVLGGGRIARSLGTSSAA
jgi:tRNA-specific 2-thiouridylase